MIGKASAWQKPKYGTTSKMLSSVVKYTSDGSNRLICGLYNLEASFTVFYNQPPRLVVQELSIDMPCSTDCYLAKNEFDCYSVALSELKSHPPSLPHILATLLREEWGPGTNKAIEGLTIMPLFVIILGMATNAFPFFHSSKRPNKIHSLSTDNLDVPVHQQQESFRRSTTSASALESAMGAANRTNDSPTN